MILILRSPDRSPPSINHRVQLAKMHGAICGDTPNAECLGTAGIRVKTRVEINRVPIIASELRVHAPYDIPRVSLPCTTPHRENLGRARGPPKRRDVFILAGCPRRVSPIPLH